MSMLGSRCLAAADRPCRGEADLRAARRLAGAVAAALGPEPEVLQVLLAHEVVHIVERVVVLAIEAIALRLPARHGMHVSEADHLVEDETGDLLVADDG